MNEEWLEHVYGEASHRVTIFGDEEILKGLTKMIQSLGNKVFIPEDHPRELFKYDPDNDHTFRYMDAGCDLCMIEGERLIRRQDD